VYQSMRPSTHDGSFGGGRHHGFSSGFGGFSGFAGTMSGLQLQTSHGGTGFPMLHSGGTDRSTPLYRYRGGRSATISRSEPPTELPRAPAVGTYQVPRILDDIVPERDDTFGYKRTAAFKSSGRSRPLMSDAIHFATKREEETYSNLGPGSYYVADSWGADSRLTVNRIPPLPRTHTSGGLPNADRPWKQPAPMLMRNNKPVSSSLSIKQLKNLTNNAAEAANIAGGGNMLPGTKSKLSLNNNLEDMLQLQKDIAAVRNLPSYV
jgi:hypothetical protein